MDGRTTEGARMARARKLTQTCEGAHTHHREPMRMPLKTVGAGPMMKDGGMNREIKRKM